jgi:hypothetical protein
VSGPERAFLPERDGALLEGDSLSLYVALSLSFSAPYTLAQAGMPGAREAREAGPGRVGGWVGPGKDPGRGRVGPGRAGSEALGGLGAMEGSRGTMLSRCSGVMEWAVTSDAT